MATSGAAAAAMMRARRKVVSWFFAVHAVTAEDAVPFAPQSGLQRRQFERMRARNVILEAEPGKYWIDVAAYDADNTNRRRRIALILGPVLIVSILVLAYIAYRV